MSININNCDLNNDYFHFTNKENIYSILKDEKRFDDKEKALNRDVERVKNLFDEEMVNVTNSKK